MHLRVTLLFIPKYLKNEQLILTYGATLEQDPKYDISIDRVYSKNYINNFFLTIICFRNLPCC